MIALKNNCPGYNELHFQIFSGKKHITIRIIIKRLIIWSCSLSYYKYSLSLNIRDNNKILTSAAIKSIKSKYETKVTFKEISGWSSQLS